MEQHAPSFLPSFLSSCFAGPAGTITETTPTRRTTSAASSRGWEISFAIDAPPMLVFILSLEGPLWFGNLKFGNRGRGRVFFSQGKEGREGFGMEKYGES